MNATLEAMARALFQSWFVDFDPVRAKLDGRHPAGLDPATAALFPDAVPRFRTRSHPERLDQSTAVGEVVECVGGGTRAPQSRSIGKAARTTGRRRRILFSQAPVLLDTDRKLTDAGIAKISSGLLPAGAAAAFLPRPRRLPRHCRHARRHQSGLHRDEVQRTRLKLLHAELVPDETWPRSKAAPPETTFAEISKQNFRPIPSCCRRRSSWPPSPPKSRRSTTNRRQPPPIPHPRHPARHAAAEAAERGVADSGLVQWCKVRSTFSPRSRHDYRGISKHNAHYKCSVHPAARQSCSDVESGEIAARLGGAPGGAG